MADDSIYQIIAGGAGASSRADFSKLSGLLDNYYKGRDEYAKENLRSAFEDGVPTDASGQPDFGAMAKTLFQRGGYDQGVQASNLDLQRKQLQLGQDAAARIGSLEGGQGAPDTSNLPPSTSRNASAVVAKPLNRGGVDSSSTPAAPAPGRTTIMQVLTAQGVPNDQLGPVSASIARQLGLEDPNAPLDMTDPRIRGVIVPAVAQFKRMGVGQVVPDGAPTPAPQVVPQQPQAAPQPVAQAAPQPQPVAPNPQQNQGTFGAPPATPTRGAVPTGADPEIQKQIAYYTYVASNPAFPKSVQEAAKARLESIQRSAEPTGTMKEYDLARRQGYQGTVQDFIAENEAKKTAATEEAKLNAAKYQGLVDAGTKAQQEIPQLQMLQEQMNDPNFFSGSGEKYNLAYKRLKSAVGIDPDAAVPQEFLRKATAANVLSSLGALKGLGQIRVAEINMAREAAASPDNSVPANKLLTEISLRTHQRNADIADLAQAYKEKNGSLDAGFDKIVTQYGRQHPLFNEVEIKDWHKVIGEQKAAPSAPAAAPASQLRFATPAEAQAAVASGKLKRGDSFLDKNGVTRYVH